MVVSDLPEKLGDGFRTCGALEYLERWPACNNSGQKTFLTGKSPCYDDRGKVSGVIGVSVDISRQRRLRTIAQSAERVGASLFIGQGNHCHCNAEALFYSVKLDNQVFW
ncbi:MAG: hypothetical protein GY782_10125 [Gammaproteobacteria bacterium]|nr:hypothetical protein [Gammaproteobacteria bacterium]